MSAPTSREQARSQRKSSSNRGLGVQRLQTKKGRRAATPTESLFESLAISSDDRLSAKSESLPSRPHGSTRPRPSPSLVDSQSAGLSVPGVRFLMDRVASSPICRTTTASSSSLQSMAAESTSEDIAFADNSLLSMVSEHHVGPRRADYVRGRSFTLDLHAQTWVDPAASGHPEARLDHELERDLMIAHNREVPDSLPRMSRTAKAGAARYVLQVLEDEDDTSPRNFHKKLDIYSPQFPLRDSQWRASLRATWSFVQRNFPRRHEDIFNEQGICVQAEPAFNLLELARIAQAIVHFEPVLDEMIRPAGDRKRNWADNPYLGGGSQRTSRPESIARIAQLTAHVNAHARPSRACPSQIPLNAVQQLQNLMAFHDWEDYRWTFSSDEYPDLSVCFARSVGGERAASLVQWAGFVSSFLQAAISCPSPTQLQRSPANRVGLRQFQSA